MIKGDEFFVALGDLVDADAEREKLQQELDYMKGFKASVEKKLSNERFVQIAPEKVVQMERQKLDDADAKIKALERTCQRLPKIFSRNLFGDNQMDCAFFFLACTFFAFPETGAENFLNNSPSLE